MRKPGKQEIVQAVSFLLCIVIALRNMDGLDGEFSGGWLTGPLLSMADDGTFYFLPALLVAFVYPRIAAAIGIAASLLCLPLYLYLTAPVPFVTILAPGHQFSVPQDPGFRWHGWVFAGIVASVVTLYICLRSFSSCQLRQLRTN